MWGMIARITTVPGRREEMIAVLESSASDMPGCLSYIVAKDHASEDALWVTEAWESESSHDASLTLRQVQDAIPRARSLVANFERIAVTMPVWGTNLHP